MSASVTRKSLLSACLSVACIVAIFPQTTFGDEGSRLIPPTALAYGHFNVAELVKASPSNLLHDLYGHVEKELATFSVQKLGIDVATLSQVTVIVPDFQTASVVGNDVPPFVVAATFASAFDQQEIANKFFKDWNQVRESGETIFVDKNSKIAVVAASKDTLVAAQKPILTWWLKNRSNQASALQNVFRRSGRNPIHVAVDFSQIPGQFHAALPELVQPFAKAQIGVLSIDINQQTTADLTVSFRNPTESANARATFEMLVKQGRNLLSLAETDAQFKLNNQEANLEKNLEAIGTLAVVRQGLGYLDQLSIRQAQESVHVTAKVESDATLIVLFALGSIKKIGENAENRFQSITEDLSN